MRAINTLYNGNYHRSRLEARWAVYFKTLGIEYEYEVEGYSTKNFNYLPDFYFPKLKFYGEVKRADFGDEDVERWSEFAKEIDKPLVIFEGLPHSKPCRAYGMHEDMELLVIPFAHLFLDKFGCFYHAGGHDDFSVYSPFTEALRQSKKQRFEHL